MTLGTTHSDVSYDGNGSNRTFDVTFEFHAASDLEVILVTAATGVERVQTRGFHYQVEGGDGELGQIHFIDRAPPPALGERVVIRRISSDLQPDDLVDGGALAAEPLERRLDIITARLQELETDIARSLKVAKGSEAPESGLTLNLTGGMGSSLQVASDEQGIILAASVAPEGTVLSAKGEELVGLADEAAMRAFLGLTTAATTGLGTSGATIPLLNGANTHSGANTFSSNATFNGNLIVGAPFVLGSETLTIASGAITPTKSRILINNEGAAATDNLDIIAVTNHPVGSVIKVQASTSGQVPRIRHNGGGGGNIYLRNTADVDLGDLDRAIWLERRDAGEGEHGAGWYEAARSFDWTELPAVATTSGSEVILATGLPSGIRELEILFIAVRTNTNNSPPVVQIAPSSGFVSTGYIASTLAFLGTAVAASNFTGGFHVARDGNYKNNEDLNGVMRVSRWDDANNLWLADWNIKQAPTSLANLHIGGGKVNLTGELDRVRLVPSAFVGAFNLGAARLRYR